MARGAAPDTNLKRLNGKKNLLGNGAGALCITCCSGPCGYTATLCPGETGDTVYVICEDVNTHPSGDDGIVFKYNNVCYEVSTSHAQHEITDDDTVLTLDDVEIFEDCDACLDLGEWLHTCAGLDLEANCPSTITVTYSGLSARYTSGEDTCLLPTGFTCTAEVISSEMYSEVEGSHSLTGTTDACCETGDCESGGHCRARGGDVWCARIYDWFEGEYFAWWSVNVEVSCHDWQTIQATFRQPVYDSQLCPPATGYELKEYTAFHGTIVDDWGMVTIA